MNRQNMNEFEQTIIPPPPNFSDLYNKHFQYEKGGKIEFTKIAQCFENVEK